ncbi:hypothetical protein V8687_18200 [Shewanella baltica]|uniref:hypothetical protein n=1 Tax=Shewanella baltica TaxID=62322 RepID=UPI0030D1726F
MNIATLLKCLKIEVGAQKTIYVGHGIFEDLRQHFIMINDLAEIKTNKQEYLFNYINTPKIKFVRVMAMDSRAIATEDPELAAILKKTFEGNRIGDE